MGARVFAQEGEYLMYSPRKITFNQYEMPMHNAAPTFFSPDLYTNAQQRGIWKQRVAQELMSMGIMKLCVWKYLVSGWRVA